MDPKLIGAFGLLCICSIGSSIAASMTGGGEETPVSPGPSVEPPPPRSIPSTVSPTGQGIDISRLVAPPPSIVYDVNAYKANYRHEGVGAYYGGNNLFHETSLSGDWRARERHCFNKCTDLPNCVIMTLGKGANNSTTQCWGKGSDGYNLRTSSSSHISYHKK